MLRHLAFLMLTYACLTLQSGLATELAWGDWKPHLVAIPLAVSVLVFPGSQAVLWAAATGLWWDGLTASTLGENLLLGAGLASLLQFCLSGQPVRWSVSIGLLVGLTAWLHGLGWRVLEAWREAPATDAMELLRVVSQQAVWTAGLTTVTLLTVRFVVRGLSLEGRPLAPLLRNEWRMLND